MRVACLLACALLLAPLTSVHAQQPDSTRGRVPLFTSSDLWYAAGFTAGTVALFPLDRLLARQLQDSTTQANEIFRLGANIDYVGRPGAFLIGGAMYAVGRIFGSERMADLGLHGTEALLLTEILTRAIKAPAGRARPLVDLTNPRDFKLGRGLGNRNYQSFPSGHTSVAFAAAAAVTAETGEWWPEAKPFIGTAMFGGAALVGLSRMYRNKHWASDVAMGATLGTFTGWKVVRWAHSGTGERFNRWLLGVSLVPTSAGRLPVVWMAPDPGR